MRNLPVHRSASASGMVSQRDRWFAWANALSIFSSLLNQRHFMPMTGQRTVRQGLDMDIFGSAVGAMEGPVNYVSIPAAASYLYVPSTEPSITELDLDHPVVAFWARRTFSAIGDKWWADRLSAGAPNIAWGFGLKAGGQPFVRLSADGTNYTDFAPTAPTSTAVWNFYAFQHRSATETNVLVNDQLTVYNSGYAHIFTGGTCDYRIGYNARSDIALVALANDDSVNCVQKLLGLYYHSRYAFRDDWT